jgi:hypothetical protein
MGFGNGTTFAETRSERLSIPTPRDYPTRSSRIAPARPWSTSPRRLAWFRPILLLASSPYTVSESTPQEFSRIIQIADLDVSVPERKPVKASPRQFHGHFAVLP